jgi:hypothetical protein
MGGNFRSQFILKGRPTMKISLRLLATLTFAGVLLPTYAQIQHPPEVSAQHMEETVRSAYGALSFICGLGPVTERVEGGQSSPVSPTQDTVDSSPTFTITDMETGSIASIGNRKLKEFVEVPSGQVLLAQFSKRYHTEEDISSTWPECKVTWKDFKAPFQATDSNSGLGMNMSEIARIGSIMFTEPATYTHYAAFTVVTEFQGKSTGPHKALFLFGYNAKGKEVVAPQDLFSGDQGLWYVVKERVYPDQLLTSPLRESPAIAEWIKANTSTDTGCSSVRSDLCCHDGRCGMAHSKVSLALEAPITRR